MDDEKLIECVRKYECIYNLKHPKYMDSQKKEIAWKDISNQLKQPGVACKQRWQCLRDSYRRALNKKKKKVGQARKNIKPWRYEEEMAFVLPYFVERKTKDLIKTTSDEDESDNGGENLAIDPNDIIHEENTVASVDASECYCPNTEDEAQTYHNMPQYKKVQAVKRKAVGTKQSTSAIIMPMLKEQTELEQMRGQDELDRFFLNISDTVKKFSPYLQALAKNKIFTLVSEMELEQLAPPGSAVFTYASSPQSESSSTLQSATTIITSHDNWDDTQQNSHNFTKIKIKKQSI